MSYPGMTSKYIKGLEKLKIINTLKNRFYSKVLLPNENGCMEWNGSLSYGYGAFWMHPKYIHAHRFSYILYNGNIDNDLCVLHKCDNKKCISPEHLFLGTRNENNKDRAIKLRSAINYANSKLDFKKAKEIRKYLFNGASVKELSEKYKISKTTIYLIKNLKIWKGEAA